MEPLTKQTSQTSATAVPTLQNRLTLGWANLGRPARAFQFPLTQDDKETWVYSAHWGLHHSKLDPSVSSSYPSFEMGDLRRCLESGEYGALKDCHLYESNFLQVTKTGDIASRVTMGIAASSPFLKMPDLMLLARPVPCLTERCECQCPEPLPFPDEELQLFALLPLKFVRLYVHDESRFQLKVRLANGRTFYLQLLAHPLKQDKIFGHWIRLLYRLRFYHSDAPITYEKENALHHHRNNFF